jgi:uncharacterized repeat protein (TIGR01451 family)
MGARRTDRAGLPFLLALLCSALGASPALAVVDVNKSFNPINILPGQTSTLEIVLLNSATTAATGVAFTDTLPSGVVATAVVANGCEGAASIDPATAVSYSGGTIPAGTGSTSGRCSILVTVTASATGTYVNTIPAGGVTAVVAGEAEDNPEPAEATLTVSTSGITGLKSFSPGTIHVGGSSVLTVTLNNPSPLPLTSVAFRDSLPTPLQVDGPVTTGGTCGGTPVFTDDGGLSLDPGDTIFRVTGLVVPGGGSCTVTIRVRVNPTRVNVAQASAVSNSIAAGAVTSAQGATNAAALSGSITVQTGAQVVKAFAPATIGLGATSTLTLTLRNYNTTAITPADLTDAMPGGITVVGPVATTCGGTATFTAAQVQMTGGTIPGAPDPNASGFGSCTVTATVRGDATGALANSIPAGNFAGIAYAATSGTLTVQDAVGVSKAFSPTTAVQSGTSTLTITLTNASTTAATITSFTDNLTTMDAAGRITIAAAPPASTSCPGATLTAVPGTTSISLAGGTIPAGPGGSCLVTVPVLVGIGAPTGSRTNTVPVGALQTSQGSNATAATARLTVTQAAGVSKSWTPATVAPGGVSRLAINVTHVSGAPAFTGIGLVDTLPANHVILPTPPLNGPVSNTCGGTVTLDVAARTITLAGGSLGTGATSCRIEVDVQAPSTTTTTSAVNRIDANTLVTAEGFTYNLAATATLSWASRVVTLNKAFSPTVVNGGGPSVAQVTIANTAPGAVALTNLSLTDDLPVNVEVYAVPAPTFTGTGCSLGSIVAVPGSSSFSLSGASVAAGSVCTLGVTVTSAVDGNHINAIPAGAVSSAQGASNTNSPSATLTVLRNINVTKWFSPNPVDAGGTSTLTIRIFNTNEVPRTLCGGQAAEPCSGSAGLVDTLPAGLVVAAGAVSSSCGGTVVAPPGGTSVTVNDTVLPAVPPVPPGLACDVTVPVTAAAAGAYANTIGAGTVRTVEGSTNPDPATNTLRAVARPTIAKAFSPASIAAGATSTVTFTLSNPNAASVLPAPGLTGATFTDTLSGMAISSNQAAAGTCGGASGNTFVTGQTALTFAGLTIPPGSPGTCTVTVVVTAATPGVYPNTASGVLTAQTQAAGTASNTPNLTVLQRPTVAKSFSPATIVPGGASTLTFTLTNPNAVAVTPSSPGFTDVFPVTPGAMTILNLTTTNTCGGQLRNSANGTLAVGNVGIRFNNGTIPANGSCTISVNVTAPAGGTYTNTSSTLATTNAGTSLLPATATLRALTADLAVTKSRSPEGTWEPGQTVAYTIVATNNGPDDAAAAPLVDDVPARLGLVTWSCAPAAACSPASGSGNAVAPFVTLASGTSVTLTVNAVVRPGGEETVTNTVTIGQPANARDLALGNNSASVDAPTIPVTLSRVEVERRGRLLRVRWTTETEVGNVGFDVVGLRGTERVPLNDELVPGALDSFEPRTYELEVFDPGVGAVYVEERDTRGGSRRHGPFAVGTASGTEVARQPIDWGAIRAEQEAFRRERRAAEEREAGVGTPRALPGTAALVAGASPRARLLVERDGIVRVTAEALRAAGASFDGQDAGALALESRGEPVPLVVACVAGGPRSANAFGPGCWVEFLGRGVKSLYTKANAYTLVVDRERAARVPTEEAAAAPGEAPASYRETTVFVRPREYSAASPTGDPWYEASLLAYRKPVSRDFALDVDAPEPAGGPATLFVRLWGVTDFPSAPDHHVVVELNGRRLGERRFDGRARVVMELALPAGVLKPGSNALRLTLPGDSGAEYDMVAVDGYGVTFERAFRARGGALAFRAVSGSFAVRGLGGDVSAYRVVDGTAVRLNARVANEGPETVVVLRGTGAPADYVVADAAGAVTPRVVAEIPALPDLSGTADLLVVAHPSFVDGLEPWIAARSAAGVAVRVVDVESAYEAWGHGIVGEEPIRALVAAAHERMGVTSVLLVGGDTSDPFGYRGAGSLSFVPTPYRSTGPFVTFAPVDSAYGDLDGDGVPEVAVGRWPVRTAAELEAVVAKTLAFEARRDTPTLLLAADRIDGTYSFGDASEAFRAEVPLGWVVWRAYVDGIGVADARKNILKVLGEGPTLANWFGHSSYGLWSFDGLFTTADAKALANRGRPFLVTQWGCWNTYHVLPTYDTLGHALLLSPDRGAAAVIGPSTLTDSDADRALGQLLMPRLLRPGMTLGRALNEARRELARTRPGAADVLLGTTLLGDPTLTLP